MIRSSYKTALRAKGIRPIPCASKLRSSLAPVGDNDNQTLAWQHQALQDMLLANFGGFTFTKGFGGWNPPGGSVRHEPVYVYDIAMDRADCPKLRLIAATIARDARQQCVMIVTPNGDVDFVKPLDETKAA